MEWYVWLVICIGGILAYLGLGKLLAGSAVVLLGKWEAEKKGEEYKGLSRIAAWNVTLFWPLYAAAIILCVGFCLLVIGFVLAVIVGLIALIIAVILAVIALATIALIIRSPIDGFTSLRGIVTKFNPIPWRPSEKEKEGE